MLIKFTRSDGHKITIPEKSLIFIEEDPNKPLVYLQYYNGSFNIGDHIDPATIEFVK